MIHIALTALTAWVGLTLAAIAEARPLALTDIVPIDLLAGQSTLSVKKSFQDAKGNLLLIVDFEGKEKLLYRSKDSGMRFKELHSAKREGGKDWKFPIGNNPKKIGKLKDDGKDVNLICPEGIKEMIPVPEGKRRKLEFDLRRTPGLTPKTWSAPDELPAPMADKNEAGPCSVPGTHPAEDGSPEAPAAPKEETHPSSEASTHDE